MSCRPVVPLSFTRHGDASRPAVILLQGLGMASNAWPAELVDALVETGLQVVLPDNRDAGKSPRVTGVRVRDVEVLGAVARTLARRKVSAAYDLDDMADDVAALADGLGIGRFHVAGFSMGGMIAQTLALRHPERILSLASLSSATGNPATGLGRLGTIWKIIRPRGPARTKEEAREEMREILLALSGPAFRGDVEALERMLDRIEDTPLDMEATKRQLLAILASGNRSEALGQIRVPTLVIHGTADPLLPFAAGEETAAVIPGARLEPVEGMGHEVPAALGRRYAELVAGNAARAEPKGGSLIKDACTKRRGRRGEAGRSRRAS